MSIEKIKGRFPNGDLRTTHPFYMADAIKDIPGCLGACLDDDLLYSIQEAMKNVKPKRIFTVGCGTSYNACQAIAYTNRALLNISAQAYDAFDFQLDLPCGVDSQALVISISHTGQTLVTCLAQEKAKSLGAFTVGVSGNSKSRLLKTADLALTDPYALEIPFGKTRCYLSSCLQGMSAAIMTASPQIRDEFIIQVKKVVSTIRENMDIWEKSGCSIASQWAEITTHYMLTGFGAQKANADEIGLKIIEVLGESATSYGLEEFTHGPKASFRKDMGIFLFQTDERSLERALSIAKGVVLSEAVLVIITDQVDAGWPDKAQIIRLPTLENQQQLGLFPAAVAAQYLIYFLAVKKGLIPDINCINLHPELESVSEIFFPPGTH
jgi:glucosamine 6-phosphate synthetase-like amidotransferase/phosphosugar isomerase protein